MTLNYPTYKETDFEAEACSRLEWSCGYEERPANKFRYDLSCDPEILLEFLMATQPEAIAKMAMKLYGDPHPRPTFMEEISRGVWSQIQKKGKLESLRDGVEVHGARLSLFFPKPKSAANPDAVKLYNANRLTYMRQVAADKTRSEIVDVVLFVNGLSFSPHELKYTSSATGWNYNDAEEQWKTDRSAHLPLFMWNAGYIVAFAVDEQDASMTTRLAGKKTFFMPYDQGVGNGIHRTTGNPLPKPGEPFATHYIYDDVFSRSSISNYITEYCQRKPGKDGSPDTLIFPRCHQRDLIEKLVCDVSASVRSKNYLVEHFAGSGKTWEIVWAAYRLAALTKPNGSARFKKILVVSNRIVLDDQLQKALKNKSHKSGFLSIATSTKSLGDAMDGNVRIVCSTVQKAMFLMKSGRFLAAAGDEFFCLIDEIQSGYEGKMMESMLGLLKQDKPAMNLSAMSDSEIAAAVNDLLAEQAFQAASRANIWVCAFSATPTETTYRLFGTEDDDGIKRAFHLYTMQQAVDEGYILNPLANVILYEPTLVAEKTVPDDPDFTPAIVSAVVKKKAMASPEAIRKKAKVFARLFTEVVLGSCLCGDEKGMIIASSRKEAMLYYLAMDALSHIPEFSSIRPLVAFTGDVEIDGRVFSEPGANGMPESMTAAAFATPDYNLLIVAEKFQVGFDEPMLCAEFIDRSMHGVASVQTTCRVDRVVPGRQKQTFLFDCRNSYDDIVGAYAPYFSVGGVEAGGDAGLSDAYSKAMKSGIVAPGEVDAVFRAAAEASLSGKPLEGNGLPYCFKTRTAFSQLDALAQHAFISVLKKFSAAYSLASLSGDPIEERYVKFAEFAEVLLRGKVLVPAATARVSAEAAKASRAVAISASGLSEIGQYDIGFDTVFLGKESTSKPADIASQKSEVRKKRLSAILKEINARYADVSEDIANTVENELVSLAENPGEDLCEAALANSLSEFAVPWRDAVENKLFDLILSPDKYLSKSANDLLKDDDMLATVAALYCDYAYVLARREGESGNDGQLPLA